MTQTLRLTSQQLLTTTIYQVLANDETEENDFEFTAVGAAIAGGFYHTSKLIPIKFKEAMIRLNNEEWLKSFQHKYKHMVDDGVLKAVDANQVKAEGICPITST